MKKTVKKLLLNRETLVNLEQSLGEVAGGVYPAVTQGAGCQSLAQPCGSSVC